MANLPKRWPRPRPRPLLARGETVYDELGRAVRSIASKFETPPPAVSAAQVATAYEAAVVGARAPVEPRTFYDAAGRVVRVVAPLGNAATSGDPGGGGSGWQPIGS